MAHQLSQLGVVDLTLLPPRGDDGYLRLCVEAPEGLLQVRAGLGAKQRDLTTHAACTVMVRPTSSSI